MKTFSSTESHTFADSRELLARQGDVIAVYKPSGINVHSVQHSQGDDLQSWVKKTQAASSNLHLLHRLDKETSGVVLFATKGEWQQQIQQWLADHLVQKTYLALVLGQPESRGDIAKPLYDQRRKRPLPARTRWEVLERFEQCALLELLPESGRKHQLRKHMQELGHSIVGDRRYPLKSPPALSSATPGRLWLHAWKIELPNGWEFEAPLPEELKAHLQRLRQESGKETERDEWTGAKL